VNEEERGKGEEGGGRGGEEGEKGRGKGEKQGKLKQELIMMVW